MSKYFFFFFIFLTGCMQSQYKETLSDEVRAKYKTQLEPLAPVNYFELLGRIPGEEELELGRQLFNDPLLSRNNDVSCATCHLSNHGFADGNSLNVGPMGKGGPDGRTVGRYFGKGKLSLERTLGDDGLGFLGHHHMFRNSLSTVNVVYRIGKGVDEGLLHDGRFGKIQFQVLLPIHTAEEMCGTNPVPLPSGAKNPFRKGGPIFKEAVNLTHAHSFNPVTGLDTGKFNAQPLSVEEIPTRRPDGSISVPTRNECLALAVAKVKLIPEYRERFKSAYETKKITDRHLAMALSSFVMTHVAINTPYDNFAKGQNSLSVSQLKGLAMFFSPIGKQIKLGGEQLTGVGCISCHSAPEFGGKGFASLGVRSDHRSPLSQSVGTISKTSGFFNRRRVQRGFLPNCHIEDVSVLGSYAPDIGRANGSFNEDDCFKFRIPGLRNVMETYPYFHHGTERAMGSKEQDHYKRSREALENVVAYHLRGPISVNNYSRSNYLKPFFDDTYQLDLIIPYYRQQFTKEKVDVLKVFPVKISKEEMNYLLDFVAEGLWDREAVAKGALGNMLKHPTVVPSGFHPSITRDKGTQLEIPPKSSGTP